MHLSDGEKLIIAMLCDESKPHKSRELDHGFIMRALYSGNAWAIKEKYSGIFGSGEVAQSARDEVVEILAMWQNIEESYERLTEEEKSEIKKEVVLGAKFHGFDGNNECEYMSVAGYYIDHLERFPRFKGRDLNAHIPTLETYRRMLVVFKSFHPGSLTSAQLIKILQEAVHPDNR